MKTVKTYSPHTKILSLILSFLIIFYLVPTSVFAEGLDNDTTVSDSSVSDNEENSTYTPEIYEVTELREENVKHFRLSDGSFVAAQYNYPVHYTDESGQLADIDNRLIDSGSEFSTNNSRVKFIKKITGNGNIFTLHENNSKITIGLVGAEKKTEGVVTENNNSDDAIESALGKMTNLENLSSTIVYEDILDGVDIEYIVHSLNIKENIIVKEKRDNYSYTFTIELNNLTANLADNGNVYITSLDGETQYVIPAPVVYDANGAYAPKDISAYTLYTTGNGKYELNVNVSSTWMNDAERAFPIVIDPPILSNEGGVTDFNIDSTAPNTNTNGNEDFWVSSTERAYLKFNENSFADIPVGASIMKAELNIIGGSFSDASAKVGAYAITTSWDGTLTWNKTIASSQGIFSSTALDYVFLNDGNGRHNWNITELYKNWLSGAPNYGVGLRLVDETANESASFTACEYYPSDDDTNLYEPVIMVTYIYNDGLEGYYPTSTHSAGVGGTGSINLSTGRLTLAIPTLTTTDYLFAFTPTLVYNSSLAGKAATSENVSSAFSSSYMPNGFKLNVQETIVKKSYRDENGAERDYYLLYDADGSTHVFYSSRFTGPYYDEDGLRLTLTVGTDEITITDIDQNIKTYSKISGGWYLTKITDKYGNQLVFHINTAYQPSRISIRPNGLSNIEMLEFVYYGDKLCAVYNNSSKDSVIFGYSGNNLSSVKYCYGNANTTTQNVKDAYTNPSTAQNVTVYATATYTYDSSGNIIKITDSDTNKSLRYEITNGKVTKLSEYAGTTLGQQVSYSYGEGYTDVRSTGNNETLNNDDDIITRYIIDDYGRSVSAHSYYADDEQIIGASMNSYENEGKAKNSIKESTIVYDGKVDYVSNGSGLYASLPGGITKTEDTGCYKQTVFEESDPASVTYNANMQYIISGFGYSNSIIQNGNAKFSLSAKVYYYQGANKDDKVVTHHFDFADVENTWQFVSGKLDCVEEDDDEYSYDVVRKIEIVCNYYGQVDVNGNTSVSYFKDVAFTDCSDYKTYRYSYNKYTGNLVMKSNYAYKEYYEYNNKNSVTRVANNKGEIYDYKYQSDEVTLSQELYYTFQRNGVMGNLLYEYPFGETNIDSKITMTLVRQTSYSYNSQGLLISSTSMGSNPSAAGILNNSYTYETGSGSKIFGATLTETDSLGYVTKYFYDNSNGNLLAQIDVESGSGYVYDYDVFGTLVSVIPATGNATSYTEVVNAENVNYEYNPNTHRLHQITTASTEYTFAYDNFGNSTGVTAGDNTLATYEYYPNNGKLKKINYGNGFSEDYVYNTLEMLSEIWYTVDGTRTKAYSYTYNKDGTLSEFENHLNGTTIEYEYDYQGRFISSRETNSSNANYKNDYVVNNYNEDGRVYRATTSLNYLSTSGWNNKDIIEQYIYNKNGTLDDERIFYLPSTGIVTSYSYDIFNRVTSVDRRTDDFVYITDYEYLSDGNSTSYLVGGYTSTVNGTATTYSYEYDSGGNITSITQGGKEVTYSYDNLGQLVREYDGKFTRNYTYDDAGNIMSIERTWYSDVHEEIITYALNPTLPRPVTTTTTLSYTDSQWGDLLTSYNGTTITYDQIGNPLTYYNGSAYTFTWTGRQLTGAAKGSTNMSFTYNDEGIRTSKTVNNVTHTYYLNGNLIVAEQWGNKLIVYLYDSTGMPIGMMYRTTSYAVDQWDVFWFEKNLQGDIVAVYNSTGTKVASYNYIDAWGNHSASYTNGGASTGAQYNPFRYRGYYYDTDLGMYYLQSRYYDPNTCRFINADSALYHSMLGYNMFAYCENNPVNYYDPTGENYVSALDWWNIYVGMFSSSTPTWVDDLVWIVGILLLGGASLDFYEQNAYQNTIWSWEYQQSLIYDGSSSIVFSTLECENDSSNTVFAQKEKDGKYDPNPYKRPGEKKQNRENRSKSRQKGNWQPRNNRRDGKPAKPKSHSPSKKGHKKYFDTSTPIDLF